jgi:hypothetical protein
MNHIGVPQAPSLQVEHELSQCPHGIPGWKNCGFFVLKDIENFFGAKFSVDDDLEHELLEPGSSHEQVALVMDLVTVGVLNSPLGDFSTLKLN